MQQLNLWWWSDGFILDLALVFRLIVIQRQRKEVMLQVLSVIR